MILTKGVFERRTPTGKETFSLLIRLEATTFGTLSVSTLLETIWRKVWAKPLLSNAKSPLPVDVRRSKTSFFKLTFNTLRGGLFFRGGGGGGLSSNVLFTGSWTYNLGGGAYKFCQFWYFVPFLYLTCLRIFCQPINTQLDKDRKSRLKSSRHPTRDSCCRLGMQKETTLS